MKCFLPSFSKPSLRAAGQKPSVSPRWFSIRCLAPSIAWIDTELAPTWHPGRRVIRAVVASASHNKTSSRPSGFTDSPFSWTGQLVVRAATPDLASPAICG